ncbi:glycosyl transferase [Pilimelia anulata]|uniref:Glycosyl transferase n=1 Tax=Pilimelia anulata TaxID=53371 RepID=A0A8J3BJZ6_9ACTN|nr:glycosyltransferase family 4 protein [Pilimelia anulata]GGK09008.1 glycosyl transferase [Pilimelia anulata]
MKVVVAHNRYRSVLPSGENVIVEQDIAELRTAGVTVLPFLRDSDDIPALPAGDKALLPLSPLYNRAAQRDLAALLDRERPDVLHLHNPYPLLSPWVVRTAHGHGVPVVQTVHNYRQVCSPGLYFRDGAVCTLCRGKSVGLPGVRHACYRGSRAQSAVMALTLAAHRPTWRSVDRYLALTTGMAAHLRDYGIAADRILVKPNSIPDPGPPPPPGEGFLFYGRFAPEKGLGLLLDAWRRHPDGSLGPLRLAGDGEQRALAEAAAAARADVEYLGPLDRAGVRAALAAASVVLAVPTWHDVLPTVVIEALAAGRPVLGTALGGVPYLVGVGAAVAPGAASPVTGLTAGDAGWVVPAAAADLAAALPVARAGAAGLGAAARERYRRTFHPDVVTGQLLDAYRGVRRR